MRKIQLIVLVLVMFFINTGFDYNKTINVNEEGATLGLVFENPVTLSIIGDSITYGAMPDMSRGLAYPERLGNLCKAVTVNNYGISGTTIAVNSSLSMVSRFQDIDKKSNLIIIAGGTNDFGMNTPMGDVNSTDTSTFNGALNYMIINLKLMFPDKYIVIDTPITRADQYNRNEQGLLLEDYANAIKEAAKRHDIYLLDLNQDAKLFFLSDLNQYMQDGLHPNADGHELMRSLILEKLDPILKN